MLVATAGCQLIGGIDARSLGEEPDAGPDGTASDAPAGGPDGMGPSDSAAAPDGLDAGTTDTGLADAGATDAGCGADAGLTYSQEVRCDAPLAYWRLDEPMGTTAKDSSGYGNDATYMGGFTRCDHARHPGGQLPLRDRGDPLRDHGRGDLSPGKHRRGGGLRLGATGEPHPPALPGGERTVAIRERCRT